MFSERKRKTRVSSTFRNSAKAIRKAMRDATRRDATRRALEGAQGTRERERQRERRRGRIAVVPECLNAMEGSHGRRSILADIRLEAMEWCHGRRSILSVRHGRLERGMWSPRPLKSLLSLPMPSPDFHSAEKITERWGTRSDGTACMWHCRWSKNG